MKVTYFKSAAEFRRWLKRHHARVRELWVGFYRKDSGQGGLTYLEALEQALCFGWIDGLKKRASALSYTYRFTPRRPKSNWSRINIEHFERLQETDAMTPAGLEAYAARRPYRSAGYSYENAAPILPPPEERQFRADKEAWKFFLRQPPGYRKRFIHWVASAMKPETRARRLSQLIAASRNGLRLDPLGPGTRAAERKPLA